jgi:sulfotransferase family protein
MASLWRSAEQMAGAETKDYHAAWDMGDAVNAERDRSTTSFDGGAVFVIGAGRSGKTLVCKYLCMHPNVGWISTYVDRFPWCPPLAALNRMVHVVPSAAQAAWFLRGDSAEALRDRVAPRKGGRRWLRFVPKPDEGEAIYALCGISDFAPPAWKITDAQIRRLRGAFDRIRRYQGATMLVSDRNSNNRRLPQLLAAFPSARFVHIVRDGRAVARAQLRAKWWNDHEVWWLDWRTPRQWQQEGGRPMEVAARNWVEEMHEIEKGVREIPPTQIVQVRYEELISGDSGESVRRIAEFLGLPCERDWLRWVSSVPLVDANERDRRSTDAEEEKLLQDIQGLTLARYGYT